MHEFACVCVGELGCAGLFVGRCATHIQNLNVKQREKWTHMSPGFIGVQTTHTPICHRHPEGVCVQTYNSGMQPVLPKAYVATCVAR